MTVLKQLSAIYLAMAVPFAVAVTLAHHPMLAAATRTAAEESGRIGLRAAVVVENGVVEPGWALLSAGGARAYAELAAALQPPPAIDARLRSRETPSPRLAQAKPPAAKPSAPPLRPAIMAPAPKEAHSVRVAAVAPKPAAPRPDAATPPLHSVPEVPVAVAKAPPVATPPAAAPPAPPVSPAELAEVKQQLKDSLTDPLYANFDLFLYVSKASQGPVAQHMFVFAKGGADKLDLRYDWIVSTGREKVEYNKSGWQLPSFTPAGYYELDPHRMYAKYRSVQWNMPMPHALFFNWVHDGDQTGLAIHAAQGEDVALLGQRASGGCIHLAPEDAKVLFDLIRDHYKGQVPRFAYDRKTHSMSNGGELMRGADGKLIYSEGYKVLVVIQDYGGSEVVATLM